VAIYCLIFNFFWGVNDLVLHLISNKQQAFQVIHLLMANSCRLVDVFWGRTPLLVNIMARVFWITFLVIYWFHFVLAISRFGAWKFLAILECKVQNHYIFNNKICYKRTWSTHKIGIKTYVFWRQWFNELSFLLSCNGFIIRKNFQNKNVFPKHPHTYLSVFSTNCTPKFSWKQMC
jgi:hypothetical protein